MAESEQAAPMRTPEQLDAVRRRSLPVAVAAAVFGIVGLVLPFFTVVTAFHPPSFLATNLAFCAMLMGAGILFYAKGAPGTGTARVLCAIAILGGMAGSMVYTKQSVDFRQAREGLELANIKALALAAREFAAKHDGQYPPDLLTLLEESNLNPHALQSPFGKASATLEDVPGLAKQMPSRLDRAKAVDEASDYVYVGSDLKSPPPDLQPNLIVAVSANTVLREHAGVAYADGHATFFSRDEAEGVMTDWNKAREKMGLAQARAPTVIQAVRDEGKSTK